LKMMLDIIPAEYEADISYMFQVYGCKIKFPAERNITTFDNDILGVFDTGLYHLPNDRPQVVRKFRIAAFGRKRTPPLPISPIFEWAIDKQKQAYRADSFCANSVFPICVSPAIK